MAEQLLSSHPVRVASKGLLLNRIILKKVIRGLFLLLLFSILSCFVFWFATRVYACITYSYPIEYGEGTVLYEASRLTTAKPIYTSNLASPYQMVNYGPFGYYLYAATLINATNPFFAGGRLLSLIATLIACSCIYLIVRVTLARWLAVAAALLPLATAPVYGWSSLFKPDMPAIAASLVAATLVYRAAQSTDFAAPARNRLANWPIYVAALGCLVAIFIKQSALAAPIAITVYLLFNSWRQAIQFGLTLLGGGSAVLLLFTIGTQGRFWQHFISYNAQSYKVGSLTTWLGLLFQSYYPLLGLSVVCIVWFLLAGQETRKQISLWGTYWVVSFGLSFSVGKIGSNWNYYAELMFISALLSVLLMGAFLNKKFTLKIASLSLPLGFVSSLLLIAQLVLLFNVHNDKHWNTPNPTTTSQAEQIAATVATYTDKGPILYEDVGWLQTVKASTDLDELVCFPTISSKRSVESETISGGHYRGTLQNRDSPDVGSGQIV